MDWAALTSRMVVAKADTNRLQWDGRPGHYEAWFLTLNARPQRLGLWLRYTLDAPLKAAPYRELWAHVFDEASPGASFGLRRRWPAPGYPGDEPREQLFSTPGSKLEEGRAQGRIEDGGHSVEWDLSFAPDPCSAYLSPWPVRALGVTASSLILANPDARYRGQVTVDGRPIPIEREPGCQAHLWGRRHLERWTWGHCNAFDGRDDCSIDGVAASPGRLGRTLTALYVRYRGLDYALAALPRLLFARGEADFPTWRFEGQARGLRFAGTFSAPPERFLQVGYEDPDGTPSRCCNTEVADLVLEVFRGGRALDRLTATGTAHLEFGARDVRPLVRASV